MIVKTAKLFTVILLSAGCMLADFSYMQTSTVTGGMMGSMMKFAGAFSKKAREPIQSTVAVKGDQMLHLDATRASIIDLGKETITNIDFHKKTYSVMTFAQMRQLMDEMSQKMQAKKDPNQPDVNFKVSVTSTGQTKQIAGFDTKEMVMKLTMESTDPKSGQKGGFLVTTDMWLAPKVPGYEEITNFYKRMSQKLAWSPTASPMMMGNPQISKGFAEISKETSKLNGMPVSEFVKMGFEGQAPPQQNAGAANQSAQQEQQAESPSAALGKALGGFGHFGGFGRKKKKAEEPKQEQQQQQAANGDASGALMQMTIEMSGFSSASVDASKFEIPAGFKQVESPMERQMRH